MQHQTCSTGSTANPDSVNRSNGLGRIENPYFHDRLRLAPQAGQGAATCLVLPIGTVVRAATTVTDRAEVVLVEPPGRGGQTKRPADQGRPECRHVPDTNAERSQQHRLVSIEP